MNQIPANPKEIDALASRRNPIALTSMAEAMELARMMSNSTLVPKEFQKQPSNCMLVIMQAMRWEMDPFAVIQHTSIISNRPMYNGQLVAAVVNTRGGLRRPLNYTYGDDKDGRYVIVSGQRRGDDKPQQVRIDLRKVRTNNVQWDKQPDQQLAYHGARVWARRWMPELMLGVYSREEFPDDGLSEQTIDPETGEIEEAGPNENAQEAAAPSEEVTPANIIERMQEYETLDELQMFMANVKPIYLTWDGDIREKVNVEYRRLMAAYEAGGS